MQLNFLEYIIGQALLCIDCLKGSGNWFHNGFRMEPNIPFKISMKFLAIVIFRLHRKFNKD